MGAVAGAVSGQGVHGFIVVLMCWLSILLVATGAHAAPLVVGVTEGLGAPLVIFKENELSGGVVKELMEELGQRLGQPVYFMPLPRKRLEDALQEGDIHAIAHVNPAWLEDPEQFLWSQSWMQTEDRFVVSSVYSISIRQMESLQGARIGTLRGFRYPVLEPGFRNGVIIRDDANSLKQNFERLHLGRLDALVAEKGQIEMFLRTQMNREFYRLEPLIAAQYERFIAFSPRAPVRVEQVRVHLQEMLEEGVVDKIIQRNL